MSFVIVFEGLPGSGKTTLKNDLMFGQLIVDRVEQILPDNPDNDEELTLDDIFRSDTLKTERIINRKGDIVLLDRYYLSTLAYQYAHDKVFGSNNYNISREWYDSALQSGLIVQPDLTVYIDTPLEASYKRKNRMPNTSEWTNQAFLLAMKEFYDTQNETVVVDGSLTYNEVKNTIITIVKEMMNGGK